MKVRPLSVASLAVVMFAAACTSGQSEPAALSERILTNAVQSTSFGYVEHSQQALPATAECPERAAIGGSVIGDHRGSVYNFPDDFVPQVGVRVLQFDSPTDAEAWAASVPECDGLRVVEEDQGVSSPVVQTMSLSAGRRTNRLLLAENLVVFVETLGTSQARAEVAAQEMVASLAEQLERAVADEDLPAVDLEPVMDDRTILASQIKSFPRIMGSQFVPQVGAATDEWLQEKYSFVHTDGCGDHPSGFNAGLLHFSEIADAANGSIDVWVYTFDEPAEAMAFDAAMRTLWNECLEAYEAVRGVEVPRIEPNNDLLGDGSGIRGAGVEHGEVGSPTLQFDLVRGRAWGRIRMGDIDEPLDPAVKAELLSEFEQLLTIE